MAGHLLKESEATLQAGLTSGLARAIGPQQAKALAALNSQRQPPHHRLLPA